MKKLTTFAKLCIVFVIIVGLFGIYKIGLRTGFIPSVGIMKALIPEKANLPDVKDALVQNVAPVAGPTTKEAEVSTTLIRGAIWEWNAQMGMIFANGGAATTKNSLMEKRNVNLFLYRQDDTNKMQEDLIACAKEIKDGAKQCSNGANFVVIMGDGSGQFAAAVNPQLQKLGDQYKLIVIGAVGYSRGEDAFMAPPEVKTDPSKAKGLLVSGVLRDGDWNIAMKWAADNAISNNPDEKTYDPDAINWINSSDYNVAATDYVAGKCEERKVIKDGHLTGDTKKVCVNATVTWTPGDVVVVQQKGGLVKIVSSKEYKSQMPAVIVGSRAFFEANKAEVTQMLAAIFEGGDQVKAFDQSLKKAGDISAKLYKDQDGAYWYKYYKGVVETDKQGNKVSLGGSFANNLADNLILFGLMPGSNDNFRSTYTLFANIAIQQYPSLFKDTPIPDVKEIEDKSYITGAQAVMNDAGSAAEAPQYAENAKGAVISERNYNINFETGKATLTSSGVKQLMNLKDNFAITDLFIKVVGYTDNTGNEQKVNIPLSLARATAIKTFLQRQAPDNFPNDRFKIEGLGSENPVASNNTSQGRASNRRVQITLLGK